MAVGVNRGIISTGDNTQNVQVTLLAGLPDHVRIAAPPGTVLLGGSSGAGVFVGREAELGMLAAADGGAQVLVGLGGAGQTTLARRFAEQRRDRDNPVWWIDGRTAESIEAGLAELAVRLDPLFDGLRALAADWTRAWLAAHRDWLLVLDDVPGPEQVRRLIEGLPDGRFLLTSRQRDGWLGLARALGIGVLGAEHAVELLGRVVRESLPRSAEAAGEPDLTGAAELCERLRRLPLAIDQAGAFIAQSAISPAAYLRLLTSRGAEALGQAAPRGGPERTVARIWSVTFERLAEDPLSAQSLRVFAWFAPNDIPRHLDPDADEPPALLVALKLLAAHHMVTLTPDAVAVHPLVQEIARTPSEEDPYRSAELIARAREQATMLLVIAAGKLSRRGGTETWPKRRRLFPHIEALAALTDPEQDGEHAVTLYGWAGESLQAQGDFRNAIRHLERADEGSRRVRGVRDERSLRLRISLAQSYTAVGEAERGAAVYEQMLPDCVDVFGEAHDLTALVRISLATVYSAAGAHERAVGQLNALVGHCDAAFGRDARISRVARFNLGSALIGAGDHRAAAEVYEDYHATELAALGADDPSTLKAATNLATCLYRLGELARARQLQEDVAERRARVLGELHPDTLLARANLANTLSASGEHERARELAASVLADREQVLGSDHPGTVASRADLAVIERASEERQPAASGRRGLLRRLGRRG
ncbi:tetratricopeptide (TPR) repeat protein [Catenulispora sp. EB89]|uniref:tetratricopeptide repeat protein n=1 Tax=Catenulispora sp. EB89 TaxID=3156257 RepID=UPI0035170BC0